MNYKELKNKIKTGVFSDYDLIQHLNFINSCISNENYELLKLLLLNNNLIVFNYFTQNKKLTELIEKKWIEESKNKINKEIIVRYNKDLSLNYINIF